MATEENEEIDTVYVGNKRPVRYADATMMSFNQGSEEVSLKSRGKAISTAVDAAEIVKRMVDGVEVEDIEIDTEEVEDEETGETIRLSSMRISLTNTSEE